MSPRGALTGCAWRAVVVLALAAGLAACSNRSSGPGSTRPAPPSTHVPLTATVTTASGAVAVVAMGTLADPHDTFWQVFFRASAATPWKVVTPPGVADNGGLVVHASPGVGSPDVLAGFEPSQALAFSPIALSVDQGRSWTPGIVQGGLAPVPDALSGGPTSGSDSVALVRNAGGEVLGGTATSSIGSKVVDRAAMATSAAGRSCEVGALTAVAVDAAGTLVGTTCASPGVVGIFGRSGGAWRQVGPRFAGRSASDATKVVRLVEVDGVTNGLVALRMGSTTGLMGVAGTRGGAWSRSGPLLLGGGDRILSTGVEARGGFVVLVQRSGGSLALDNETGPGGAWQVLPAPPRGTAAVVVGSGGVVDALSVASTRLTDHRLDAATASWANIGTVTVPIQFGSSS
ncbi:MAG TPA: hypothetical protein VII76_10965 [Acidimicrobiales bacterium]